MVPVIRLPDQVSEIINTIEAAGYEAFAVGGCIRDSLLGREPADWDITTSAKPEEIKRIFRRTVDTGIQHGTVTVLLGSTAYEVTTYRIDGEYEDSRHPKEVSFTGNLEEDLKRRDFTINAMAYNESSGLVDIFEGRKDLKNGIVCCVGNARERFTEDALRILRAVRFAGQLGFSMHPGTEEAARELAPSLEKISAERIQTELVKLVTSPHPELLKKAWELGLTSVFLPEFDACMDGSCCTIKHSSLVGEHTLRTMQYTEPDKVLRLAALCQGFGKPACMKEKDGREIFCGYAPESVVLAEKMLKRLKFDNDTIANVKNLVAHSELWPKPDPVSVRKAMVETGPEKFGDLLQLMGATILADSDYGKLRKLLELDQIHRISSEILERGDCLSLKQLAVTGKDLRECGVSQGKEIGEILQKMLNDVLEDPAHNERNYLLEHFFS